MEDLLCKAFDEVYEHEFDKYKKGRFHFFSFRHRRMMKELFSRLETKNVPADSAYQEYQYVPKKKRPSALIVAIVFSILLSLTAGAIAAYNFGFKKHPDHTLVFLENNSDAPATIDYVYMLDPVPDGFKETDRTDGLIIASVRYESEKSHISLSQNVKKSYISHLNTEEYEIIKTDVNGYDGFYIEYGVQTHLTWDNGDYILSLDGTLNKDELIELAKCVKTREAMNQHLKQ